MGDRKDIERLESWVHDEYISWGDDQTESSEAKLLPLRMPALKNFGVQALAHCRIKYTVADCARMRLVMQRIHWTKPATYTNNVSAQRLKARRRSHPLSFG